MIDQYKLASKSDYGKQQGISTHKFLICRENHCQAGTNKQQVGGVNDDVELHMRKQRLV